MGSERINRAQKQGLFLHSDGTAAQITSTDEMSLGAFKVSSAGSRKDGDNEDFEGQLQRDVSLDDAAKSAQPNQPGGH